MSPGSTIRTSNSASPFPVFSPLPVSNEHSRCVGVSSIVSAPVLDVFVGVTLGIDIIAVFVIGKR